MSDPLFRRREALVAGAAGLVAPLAACAQKSGPSRAPGRLIAGETCPATPRQTEGPFYFDPRLARADIAEGRPGAPLRLRLQVVDADGCVPGPGARVDVWHCDAGGVYSGYEREGSAGETFMRGTQTTDGDGVVAFRTVYPGWYVGRAPHIHLKAWLSGGREITSQLYFPDELSDSVYGDGPYRGRTGRRLRNGDDGLFRSAGGHAPIAQVSRAGGLIDAALVIALA